MPGYEQTAVDRRDHTAVVCQSESLTYGELDDRSSQLAHLLRSAGAVAGSRVAIMLPNSIEFVECLAATAKLEVLSLTLNWHLRAEELSWILGDAEPSVLVADRDLADCVEQANAEHGVPVVWVGEDYERQLAEAAAATALADRSFEYAWPTTWPVLYTSGTSGRPKGVVHGSTADPAIMRMAQDGLSAMWGYTAEDVHLVAGPMYHAGPAGYANMTLYLGGTVVVMDSWSPTEFLHLVETHHVTTTFLTPAHFIRLLELPAAEFTRRNLSSLRHVIHAGAPCPATVKHDIIDRLAPAEIWELYGMSEGGATRVSPTEWLDRPGTVGRPWPGVELRIVDTEEPAHELPTGADGLIYVKPAMGRFHYHNDADKTDAAWRDGAFTVGDVGHVDDDGYLYVTDRISDMVIRAGVNVYPREIEELLHRHPDVVDCAVFGIPDDRDGEHLKAVVETRGPVDTDELVAWCRAHLDPFKVPSEIERCDTLPRDPNGKVLKRHLRDQAWARAGRQV